MRRTQVGIIGAGPAGLLLSHLLHQAGVESVVLECRSRSYVEQRIRTGVLEDGTRQILQRAGVGERMMREGMVHGGIFIAFEDRLHHIDFPELTGGHTIVVYGQQEVVKDLIRGAAGGGWGDLVRSRGGAHRGASGPTRHRLPVPGRLGGAAGVRLRGGM